MSQWNILKFLKVSVWSCKCIYKTWMGRKLSLTAQKASNDECWLKEWFLKFIRAASGIIFLCWSPQLSTAYGRRARVFLIRTFLIFGLKEKKRELFFIFMPSGHTLCPARQHKVQRGCHLTDLHCPPWFSSLFNFPALDHCFKLISLIMIF